MLPQINHFKPSVPNPYPAIGEQPQIPSRTLRTAASQLKNQTQIIRRIGMCHNIPQQNIAFFIQLPKEGVRKSPHTQGSGFCHHFFDFMDVLPAWINSEIRANWAAPRPPPLLPLPQSHGTRRREINATQRWATNPSAQIATAPLLGKKPMMRPSTWLATVGERRRHK